MFIIVARLHFYPPEFRFFQNSPNALNPTGGTATSLTSIHERRIGNSDESTDSHLVSPIIQHNSTNSNTFSHPYQTEKQQKQEDVHRSDALATLMNGKIKTDLT